MKAKFSIVGCFFFHLFNIVTNWRNPVFQTEMNIFIAITIYFWQIAKHLDCMYQTDSEWKANCRESLLDNKQNGAPAIFIVQKLVGRETLCVRFNKGVFLI